MAGYTLSIEIGGDRELFERSSKALRNPRDFMRNVGVHAMSRGVERLETVLKQDDDAIRSGRLGASLMVGSDGGGGSGDTVFELSDTRVEVGSNLVYAAQVQFGGTILPKNAKALAIPLLPQLSRLGLGPREVDPTGDVLRFVPIMTGKPNVFGLLVDDPVELTGRQTKKRGQTGYGPGALYVLAYWVTQQPRPFLFFDEEDKRYIREELFPRHLGLR